MIPGTRAAIVAAIVLGALQPVAASAQVPAPKLGKPQQAIELRNRAQQPIAYAQATVTGQPRPLVFPTNPPIQTSVGQQVYVPAGSCITGVMVRFADGRTLRLDNQHDCLKPTIEVEDNYILLTSGAVSNPPRAYEKRGEVLPPAGAPPPAAPSR